MLHFPISEQRKIPELLIKSTFFGDELNSGCRFPVSHMATALLLMCRAAASSLWLMPFSFRNSLKRSLNVAMFFTFFPSVPTYNYTRSVSKNNKKYSQNVLTDFTIRDILTSCSRGVSTAEPEPLKKITHWGYNRRHPEHPEPQERTENESAGFVVRSGAGSHLTTTSS